MKQLFIDTSTESLIVILSNNRIVQDFIYERVKKDHASKLLPSIKLLLSRNHLTSKDIEELFVGYGPGSYTGVRIGVTVAKVLAYSLNTPLYAVSSLKVIAASYIGKAKYIIPLIDARRNHAFTALYEVENSALKTILPDNLYAIEEVLGVSHKINSKELIFCGLDSDHFEQIQDYHNDLETDFNPQMVMDLQFDLVQNLHAFVPNYKRISEAERNLL